MKKNRKKKFEKMKLKEGLKKKKNLISIFQINVVLYFAC